jgi:excisionase family DNA binding protein
MANLEERLETVESAVKMAGLTTKEVLTFDEAATFAGLSKSYLYKLTSGQKIPHYKPAGKLCYFNREELVSWLQQNRISTTDETAKRAQAYCMEKVIGGRKK